MPNTTPIYRLRQASDGENEERVDNPQTFKYEWSLANDVAIYQDYCLFLG